MGNPQAHPKGLRVTFSWLVKPKTLTGEHKALVHEAEAATACSCSFLVYPESCTCCQGCTGLTKHCHHRTAGPTCPDGLAAIGLKCEWLLLLVCKQVLVSMPWQEVWLRCLVTLHIAVMSSSLEVPCRHLHLL